MTGHSAVSERWQKGVGGTVMPRAVAECQHAGHGRWRPDRAAARGGQGDQEPLTGAVCVADGAEHEFSGWSELFAVLQTLLAPSR